MEQTTQNKPDNDLIKAIPLILSTAYVVQYLLPLTKETSLIFALVLGVGYTYATKNINLIGKQEKSH